MTYKEIFTQDKDYQNFLKEFKQKSNKLESMINEGVYHKSLLREISSKVLNDAREFAMNYRRENLEKIKEEMSYFENRVNDVGYSDRPNEAKEFEMLYKLADDRELESMVYSLNSHDLLEINLLRIELKNRGLKELDRSVKNHVIRHGIDGLDENEQREYDKLSHKLGVFNTLNDESLVIDDSIKSVNALDKDFNKMIVAAKEEPSNFMNKLSDEIKATF